MLSLMSFLQFEQFNHLSFFLSVVCLLLIAYKFYKSCTYRPPNFPPGPPSIPFLGSYLFFMLVDSKFLYKGISKFCDYYKTKVIGFYFGKFLYLATNDSEATKEILVRPEFDGRPLSFLAQLRDPNFVTRGW